LIFPYFMVIKKTPGCHDFFVLIFFIRYRDFLRSWLG